MPNNPTIVLVIPCYNERKRLDLGAFKRLSGRITFVFVDDASVDGTYEFISEGHIQGSSLIRLGKNSGKAEAVRHGFEYVMDNLNLDDSSWVGFWDADLATPLDEVFSMIEYERCLYGCSADAVVASRIYRHGSEIRRSFIRRVLSQLFMAVSRVLFPLDFYDTQCGAKIFRKRVLGKISREPFVSKWIFDIEILTRLKDFRVIEFPVHKWNEMPGSKIKLMKSVFQIMADILKIKMRF